MVDLMLLCMISWLSWTGYRLGGKRALIHVSGLVGMMFVLNRSIPWLKLVQDDSTLNQSFTNWVLRLLSPVIPAIRTFLTRVMPVSTNGSQALKETLSTLYVHASALGYAVAVYFGLHIAGESFDTLWPFGHAMRYSRIMGAIVGGLVGVFAGALCLNWLLLWMYVSKMNELGAVIYPSLLVHVWTQWWHHGIVG